MLLAVDIGNTNITLGVYDGKTPGPRWRVRTSRDTMPDEYGMLLLNLLGQEGLEPREVRGIAIASVVPPLTQTFQEVCERYLRQAPFVVDAGVRTGVRIRYRSPREVGADRIVDALAAKTLYGMPATVVDFGTATTFDAVSGEGDYLGGAIAPGIGISADALFSRTARLPRVEIVRPPSVIGGNTVESIQSGLFFGYVGLVEGMVARFREVLGPNMVVVATGGLASLVASETRAIDVVDPWLTLEGLRLIWDMNRGDRA